MEALTRELSDPNFPTMPKSSRKKTLRTGADKIPAELGEFLDRVAEERKKLQRVLSTADTAARSVKSVSAAITEAVNSTREMAARLSELERQDTVPAGLMKEAAKIEQATSALEQAIKSVRQIKLEFDVRTNARQGAVAIQGREKVAELTDGAAAKLRDLEGEINASLEAAQAESRSIAQISARMKELETTLSELGCHTQKIAQQADRAENIQAAVQAAETSVAKLEVKIAGMKEQEEQITGRERTVGALVGGGRSIRDDLDRYEAVRLEFQKMRTLHGETLASVSKVDASVRGLEKRLASLVETAKRVERAKENAAKVTAAASDLEARAALLDGLEVRVTGLDVRSAALERMMQDLDERRSLLKEFEERTQSVEGRLDVADKRLGEVQAQVDDLDRVEERASFAFDWLQEASDRVKQLREDLSSAIDREDKLMEVAARVESLSDEIDAKEATLRRLVEDLERADRLGRRASVIAAVMEDRDRRFREWLAEGDDVASRIGEILSQLKQREEGAREKLSSAAEREDRMGEVARRIESLSAEIGERERALGKLVAELERVEEVRASASEVAESLGATARQLRESLAVGEETASRTAAAIEELKEREESVRSIEDRFTSFEDRLYELQCAEEKVVQQIEGLMERQGNVKAVRDEMARAFELAEKTLHEVRAIGKARDEVAATRKAVGDVLLRAAEIDNVADRIARRKKELEDVESRIGRLESVLSEVRDVLGKISGGEGEAAILRLLKG